MSEDNFLLSDTIKSKKIILNEKDLSEDISSLHVVASTNTGGGGASDQDISSLAADTTALTEDFNQDISSLSFSEAEINQQVGLDISSLHADDTQLQDDINSVSQDLLTSNQLITSNTNSISNLEENISSLSFNQGSVDLDSINESISSLSFKQLGSIEQVSVDYSVGQDAAISAEYRFNESINGLTNISDSLSNSADAVLSNSYNHNYNQTVNGVDISTSRNNNVTLPSLQPSSDQFISFLLWTQSGYGAGTFNQPLLMNSGWSIDYDKSTTFGFEMQITAGTTTLNIKALEEAFLSTYTIDIENQQAGDPLYEHNNNGSTLATVIRIASGITTVSQWMADINDRTGGHFEISLVSGSGDDPISNFTNQTYSSSEAFREILTRNIKGNGYSVSLQDELSIITVKRTGEVVVLNDGLSNSVVLGSLDFSNQTDIYWFSSETMSIPYIIMGTDYSLIDKAEWYLANQLNALDSLPSSHSYKNTAPEGSIQEQFISDDAFFSSFYQDYLQLKQTVSSLSAS